jgi:AraC-like DNA-binding protein
MPAAKQERSETHHQSQRFHGELEFGLVTYRKGGHLGPRWQQHYQLVFLYRGAVRIVVDGMEHRVRAGEGILLSPGHLNEFYFSQEVEARHGWCQIEAADLPTSQPLPDACLHQVSECREETLALFRMGLRVGAGTGLAGRRFLTNVVLAVFWSFLSGINHFTNRAAPSPGHAALARFQLAVQNHGAEKPTLRALARKVGVSPGYLIQLVREGLGSTPIELVWRARVTQAARLLRETGLTIAEIAHQTGFPNPYHFSRRFRQQFGLPPRAWRLQNWGQETRHHHSR